MSSIISYNSGRILIIFSVILVVSNKQVLGLNQSPKRGDLFTISNIYAGEENPVLKISPQVRVNDPKYSYGSEFSWRVNGTRKQYQEDYPPNIDSSPSQVQVKINSRGLFGFLGRTIGKNGTVERVSPIAVELETAASEMIRSVEWDQVYSQTFRKAVIASEIPAGAKRVRRVQYVQPTVVQNDEGEQGFNPPPHQDVAKMARFIVRKSSSSQLSLYLISDFSIRTRKFHYPICTCTVI